MVTKEAEVVKQVEEIVDGWSEYNASGDPSVFTEMAIFSDDIVLNNPGESPAIGRDAVLERFESTDPTAFEWETTIDDVIVGRDLVIARLTFRAAAVAEHGYENERVVGTSIDAYQRQEDGSLKQILSSPSHDE